MTEGACAQRPGESAFAHKRHPMVPLRAQAGPFVHGVVVVAGHGGPHAGSARASKSISAMGYCALIFAQHAGQLLYGSR